MMNLENGTDLLVFSSEPYGSASVRTSTMAREHAYTKRVYFIEKPVLNSAGGSTYYIIEVAHHLYVVRPYIDTETSTFEQKRMVMDLVKDLIMDENISHYSIWTDTPAAMPYIRRLTPETIIYDCVQDYTKSHPELETELLQYADEILTTGLGVPVKEGPLRLVSTNQFRETYFNV